MFDRKKVRMCMLSAVLGVLMILCTAVYWQANSYNLEVQSDENDVAQSDTKFNDEEIYAMSTSAIWAVDITKPEVIAEKCSNIAIVKITAIDGADNYSEVYNDYVFPYTYGKMTVIENFKGDLPVGENVVFYKIGGTLDVDRFYEGLNEGEREKFDYVTSNGSMPRYVKRIWEDDIELEVGKEYLVYLKPETTYRANPDSYAIVYSGGGTREVRISDEAQARSISGFEVLNNFTGEWEKLDDVMK